MRSIDVIEKTVTKISEILSPISTPPPYQTPSGGIMIVTGIAALGLTILAKPKMSK